MKQKSLLLFVPTLLLAGLASCTISRPSSSSSPSKQDVSSLEAFTAMKLASKQGNASFLKKKAAMAEEDLSSIKNALPALEAFYEGSGNIVSSVVTQETVIGETTFTHVETLSFAIGEIEESFFLYYNLTTESEEGETKTKKEGLASKEEGVYFPFYASYEEESEEGEQETGQEFFLATGESSFVHVEEEFEVEEGESEHSLHYTVQENGILTTDFEIEIEQEDGTEEISLEIGPSEYRVKRIASEEGTFFEIYEDHGEEVLATYKKETDEFGNVTYVLL